ncbi:hypothetical protein AK812_SmicGene13216 [Symbiodinium microadriaticum]|uniref:Uncharacterized protein n=1 Tax=Symbiodinium microadriaticum TaxID=2951 RepID=A0A1Q9E8N8_SYMMI|nr:hypothetical protein AK812_SmicGene13216 [Symbiodinium microadriaticum]
MEPLMLAIGTVVRATLPDRQLWQSADGNTVLLQPYHSQYLARELVHRLRAAEYGRTIVMLMCFVLNML